MSQIQANKPTLSLSSGIWLGNRKAQGIADSSFSCSSSTCFDRLSVLPFLSSPFLSPTRKVVRLAAVLLLSAFTLSLAPSNSRAATVAIFGVSTVQDAGGTALADGVLVRVGTFGAQTDATIRSYFSTDTATTRTNLEGNFSVFGSGTLTGGQIFFDPTETVELNYDTTPGAQATYGDKDIYVMIFNNAVAGSATQVGLFRGIVDQNSRQRVYRFASDNSQGSDLEFSPVFIETMFGNFQTPGDGTYQLGALNEAYGITSALTATATRNNAFSYAITANNGPTSYSTTALPAGLNVSAATGVISGTPTAAAGDYSITIRATGASDTAVATLTLTLQNPAGGVPSITSNTADQTATAGVVFPSYTITGSDSPTSYGASGLPIGLIVDTNTGVISGTATQTGTFTVTITATNGSGSGSSQFTLTVTAPTLSFSNKAFTLQTADTTAAPTPTTGFVPTSYTLQSGTLPSGLMLDAGTGRISGTPTQTATATLTIRGTRAGVSADGTITVTVNTALATINSASTFSAAKGTSLAAGSGNYQITTAPSPSVATPTSFVIVSGSLAPGLTLNTSSGVISGTPNTEGVFTVGLSANNGGAQGGGNGPTFNLTITVEVAAPAIDSSLIAFAGTYTPFTYVLSAANIPTSYSVENRPAWVSSATTFTDGADGKFKMRISGQPTAAGRHELTVSAFNTGRTGGAQRDTETLVITVYDSKPSASSVGITPPGTGQVGVPFSTYLTGAARDVNDPVYFNATGLPSGLTFGSAAARQQGLITGTPTKGGIYPVKVYMQNPKGYTTTTLTITILPLP